VRTCGSHVTPVRSPLHCSHTRTAAATIHHHSPSLSANLGAPTAVRVRGTHGRQCCTSELRAVLPPRCTRTAAASERALSARTRVWLCCAHFSPPAYSACRCCWQLGHTPALARRHRLLLRPTADWHSTHSTPAVGLHQRVHVAAAVCVSCVWTCSTRRARFLPAAHTSRRSCWLGGPLTSSPRRPLRHTTATVIFT
jgi:hypothetical protein